MRKKMTISLAGGGLLVAFLVGAFLYVIGDKKKIELDFVGQNDSREEVTGQASNNQLATVEQTVVVKEALRREEEDEKELVLEKKSAVAVEATASEKPKEVAEETKLKIEKRPVSWGFQSASGRKIDVLVVHSSYDALGDDPYSVSGVLAEYQEYGVSPHYLIDRKGVIYRLVEEKNIAYHAGESQMPDGRKGVNAFSLGVEILTTKQESPTAKQYEALNLLIVDLKERYQLTAILGHKEIAPGRKDDPWNFDWKKVKK